MIIKIIWDALYTSSLDQPSSSTPTYYWKTCTQTGVAWQIRPFDLSTSSVNLRGFSDTKSSRFVLHTRNGFLRRALTTSNLLEYRYVASFSVHPRGLDCWVARDHELRINLGYWILIVAYDMQPQTHQVDILILPSTRITVEDQVRKH